MRSRDAIQGRLDGLLLAQNALRGDVTDIAIMIRELTWVLEDDTPIEDMPRSQPWTSGDDAAAETAVKDLIS